MNNLLKTTLLAFVAAAMVTSVKAQYAGNDLILGVRTDTAANDLIINLGNANTAVGANGSLGQVVDLSSFLTSGDLSTFGAAFQMGVVGGQPTTVGRDLYATVLRTALGTPTVAGSSGPSPINGSFMASGVGDISQLAGDNSLPAGTKATVTRTSGSSWSSLIAPGTGSSGQFINDTGINPMATATSSLLYEDLYRAVPNGQFAYLGYFTLDNTGASPLLTFTSALAVVPEPSTYGVLAAGGLLLVTLGRQFSRRQQA